MNLIIQPEAGLSPVVRAIQRAKRTVGIAIFRTDREEIEKIGVLITNATVARPVTTAPLARPTGPHPNPTNPA